MSVYCEKIIITQEWIVAHCHANAESKVEMHLRRQGFEVYLPKYKKVRRHARRVDTVTRPLFPRYLFIGFDPDCTLWRAIRSTVGVSYLVSAGERPVIAPGWIIEQLRECEDEDGLFAGGQEDCFKKGKAVRVTSGPFLDRVGVFDGLTDQQRVTVLLNVMGQQVRTRIPRQDISAVS